MFYAETEEELPPPPPPPADSLDSQFGGGLPPPPDDLPPPPSSPVSSSYSELRRATDLRPHAAPAQPPPQSQVQSQAQGGFYPQYNPYVAGSQVNLNDTSHVDKSIVHNNNFLHSKLLL